MLAKFLNQNQHSTPEEYKDLSVIYNLLGDGAKANYYSSLFNEVSSEFYKLKIRE
ncbi:MAG: hypothetical protein PF517_14920 [Salinivirgaceae bacterium]|jgi:hypothetical protein|nr:hypothetical protein [Salinivirgaceae bacterium]